MLRPLHGPIGQAADLIRMGEAPVRSFVRSFVRLFVSRTPIVLWWMLPYQGWNLHYLKAGRCVPLQAQDTDPSLCRAPGEFAVEPLNTKVPWGHPPHLFPPCLGVFGAPCRTTSLQVIINQVRPDTCWLPPH